MTTTDETALLAAIRDNPEDDTPRLVYADWLQENNEAVECPTCLGTGSHAINPYELAARYGAGTATRILDHAWCGKCDGSGRIPGGRADRAELIRVQCELARTPGQCDKLFCDGQLVVCDECKRWKLLRRRERELIAAHPEWSKCECPECKSGWVRRPDDPSKTYPCQTCGGTGDLFVIDRTRDDETLTEGPRPRKLLWGRGFIGGIELRSDECWREIRVRVDEPDLYGRPEYETRTVPTPLLLALVRQVPTLRRVMLTSVDPPRRNELKTEATWHWRCHHLPGVLDLCDDDYASEAEARDALALAIPEWAREWARKAGAA